MTLYDIDSQAIEIAKQNVANLDLDDRIEFVKVDIDTINQWNSLKKKYDIVVTNPPFGIRSKTNADVNFLKSAINVLMSIYNIV